MTPEELARQEIDRQLARCGWAVQSRNEMNTSAAQGVAIREFPMLYSARPGLAQIVVGCSSD
jgi:hypothetical protein